MKEFLKRFRQHGFASWRIWLGLSFFIILFSYLALGEFRQWFFLRGELADQEEEIQKTIERIEETSLEIKEVSNPNFLEKEARIRLNLKKEGEEVFIVVGLENIIKEEDFSEIYKKPIEEENKIWLNIKSWANYFFR